VRGVQVPLDKAGESRGFGFVTVEAADVDKVRYEMNGAFIGDRQISVELRESTGKALSAQLVSSATAADVLALFDTKGDDFNDECFAASLYRLGVLGPSPEASSPLLRKLLEGAASSLRNASAPWEPRPLVHACWGAAKLGVEAPALFEAMAAASLKKIATFTPQELANAAWAYATAGESHRALFEAIAAEAPKKMATFKPQDLANIVWAFSKTGFEAPTLFETVAAEAPKKMAFFNANHLANTVWAFATAGVEAPELFQAVASEAPKKIETFSPQALANVAWAFSTEAVEAPAIFDAVATASMEKMATFDSQALANIVWAYSTAGVEAPELFEAVAAETLRKMATATSQDVANTVWAYATAGVRPRALFEAVASEAQRRVSVATPSNLANVAWAFSAVGVEAPTLFEAMAVRVDDHIDEFRHEDLALLHQVYINLRASAPHHILTAILSVHAAELRAAYVRSVSKPSQAQRDVSAALTRVGWIHDFDQVTAEGFSLGMAQPLTKLAFEFDGPGHYLRGYEKQPRRVLDGASKFKGRMLRQLGWRVTHVPYFEWAPLKTQAEQHTYLRKKIKAAAKG